MAALTRSVQLREAKATLSALLDAAEKGEASITRGTAAVLVPMAAGARIPLSERPSFADFLLGVPADFEIERDPSPLKAADL